MTDREPLWPAAQAPGSIHRSYPEEKEFRAREEPWLDPYLLPGDEPRPTVIICPGGGYHNRADHEGEPVARRFNDFGLHAVVLHYRVFPWQHPVPHGDAGRAIRLLRHRAADWRIDTERIAILGFSAGGHLAGSAAVHWDHGDPAAEDPIDRHGSRPDAAVLCYPVVTMRSWRHEGSRRGVTGDERNPPLEQHLSLEAQVTAQTPPCFLWHTATDRPVPVQNSLRFAEACARQGVPVELHVFPQGAHGLGLGHRHGQNDHVAQWPELCQRWLRQLGWIRV